MRSLRKDIPFSQDLSLSTGTPLSFTTTIGRAFKLEQITIHANVPITETITITLDSALGAAYDVVIAVRTLTAAQSYVYKPDGESNYQAGDEIKIECTAANDTGTVSGVVKTSEILL